ncbi:ribosome recycling factor [Buchnera aphidicola]|uniref:Ribosome-recycling factor n=1 Tax=Buchnera aphidicola subsp. Tuberolachnus salignus TaxID=98804 RepID=A0A160SY51_BUCTT|nr:ribosome recycling factor [Buchnera aphidicola]CUR53134.1 Ribosome-recycling factor [Buchnera aphidicola (Tuberolachnus salignus)]
MLKSIKEDLHIRMNKCVNVFSIDLKKVRTNNASPVLIENILINYFGTLTPLKNLSNIIVEDSRTLKITVFDISITTLIEKEILNANLGLNPISEGANIRVYVPSLTEERRLELIKIIKNDAENIKISIRNLRRDGKEKIKKLLKKKYITKDCQYSFNTYIQEETNFFIKKIDSIVSIKEKELLNI